MNEQEYQDRLNLLKDRMIALTGAFTGLTMDIANMPNREVLFDHADHVLDSMEELIEADWPKTTDIASLIKGIHPKE